ncbi:MAG: hypothetical protein MJ152_02695 [Clostridia bacterium]|nr:hypothetical protein [Clostridia bacterium]
MKKLLYVLLIVPLLFVGGCKQPQKPDNNQFFLPATENVYYYDVNPNGYLGVTTNYVYDADLLGYTATKKIYDDYGNGVLKYRDVETWKFNADFTNITCFEKTYEVEGTTETLTYSKKYTLTFGENGSYTKTEYNFHDELEFYYFANSITKTYNQKGLIVEEIVKKCDYENSNAIYTDSKTTYTYDAQDRLTKVEGFEDEQNGSTHTLIVKYKDEYTYEEDKITRKSYYKPSSQDDWQDDAIYITTFETVDDVKYEIVDVYFENYHNHFKKGVDSFGNVVYDEVIYYQPAPSISSAAKLEYEANANGKLTKCTQYVYDKATNNYVATKETSLTLDENNLIISCQQKYADEITGELFDLFSYNYNYNSNKQLSTYTGDMYNNQSQQMERVAKYEYTYTSFKKDELYSRMETFISVYMNSLDELYDGPDYIF